MARWHLAQTSPATDCSSIPWWPVEATNNQTCKYHNECVLYQCNCKHHNAATSPLMPPIWRPRLNRVLSYRQIPSHIWLKWQYGQYGQFEGGVQNMAI